jgi:hypothetical protein
MRCIPPILRSRGLLLLLLSIPPGCDGDRVRTYPVTGAVRFEDGTPVMVGIVEAESLDHGTTATGTIQPDGSFVLGTYRSDDGAAAGRHRVIVMQMLTTGAPVTHQRDHGDPVDRRYASYNTSPLELTVEPIEENVVELTVRRAE